MLHTDKYPVDQNTLTERYTAETIRFIRENKDHPFFIYLPHAMPHLPVMTSERFQGTSDGARYGDVIETLDWSTGHILDVLKEEGLEENTLVIFTSDNGPWNNLPPRMYNAEKVEKWDSGTSGPFRGAKATTWEGGLRVPCIMRWPGTIDATQVCTEQVSSLDLFPTLLKLVGAELPADRSYDGTDIWSVITEEANSPHDYYYYFWVANLQGIRDQEWKLIFRQEAEDETLSPRLFHLKQDPYEIFNLAAQNPEVVEQLWTELKRFGMETGAKLPEWEP